ncbi:MAG: GntR family transcriptional regulator [Rubrivivax sp.]|nr:GntR family transcriptional regulator [Rubrivivax sp.]
MAETTHSSRADSAPLAGVAEGVAPAGPLPAFAPLYQQIKSLLLRSLQLGEWQPGQPIPSEMELASRYRVSQGTVRKAIDELAAENLLVRRQGKGTFVATHAEEKTQYRFLRLAPDAGGPAQLQRRLLDCRRMRSTPEVAAALQLPAGEPVVEVRRLLLDGERPVVLDDLWLPGAAFKGLDAQTLQQWRGPLYRLFESEYSVRMIRAEEQLRAVAASAEEAALLQVAPGAALLSVERRSFTYGDRPVELRRGLYHTDRHHYRNVLS